MLTTFWDLCSDVILEICGYFTVDELFLSFYPDVLPYLFELLTASRTNLHLCLTNDDLLNATLFSLINIDQVISVHISSGNIPLNIFNTVKKLTLNDFPNMNSIIFEPSLLPSLQRLVLIYSGHLSYQTDSALRLAFSHPTLQYLRVHLSSDYLLLPRNLLGESFSIKQLVINASCSQSTLNFLFNSLPFLRILRLRTLMNSVSSTVGNQMGGVNVVPPPSLSIKHASLQILDLVWYHPTMADIKFLLLGLSNLKQCRLSGVMNYKELNGEFWHQLITQTCLNLSRININMLVWTGTEAEDIKLNFDQNRFFERINFKLKPSDKENELLILIGDFRRSVQ